MIHLQYIDVFLMCNSIRSINVSVIRRRRLTMIRTFIFFDLETTGFITKTSMPKITEMSLIGVSRSAICDTLDPLPRVLHKLIIPIHPGIQISKKITELTALSDANLQSVKSFNSETYALINNFMKQLVPPLCFVAYNGNAFDYPILLWEFKNVNEAFNEDIRSIDMLHLVRDFFTNKNDASSSSSNTEDLSILLNDNEDEVLSQALDSFNVSGLDILTSDESEIDFENSPKKAKLCKSTAKPRNSTKEDCSSSRINAPHISCYEKIQKINEKTPENQKYKNGKPYNKSLQHRHNAKRNLDFAKSPPHNFKLPTIYKYIFSENPKNVHSAEGDCLTMIQCAITMGNYFVQWADHNACPLNKYSNKR